MDSQALKQELLSQAMEDCDPKLRTAILALDTVVVDLLRRVEKLERLGQLIGRLAEQEQLAKGEVGGNESSEVDAGQVPNRPS